MMDLIVGHISRPPPGAVSLSLPLLAVFTHQSSAPARVVAAAASTDSMVVLVRAVCL